MTGAIRLAQGKEKTLASSAPFAMVKKQLPAQSAILMFADAEPLVDLGRPEMGVEDVKVADAILKRVGVVGLAAENSGNDLVMRTVIPFKK